MVILIKKSNVKKR